jgi:hypothetical protein
MMHCFPIVTRAYLGTLYLAKWVLEDAIRMLEQGLALCRASSVRSGFLPLILGCLGSASVLQGRLAEGRALLEEGISESLRAGALFGQAYRVTWLSEVWRLAGRVEEAWPHAHQALDLARQHKERANEAKSAVGRLWERTFLGCRFTRRDFRRCISPEAVKRLKERVRDITRRTWGRCIERVAQELRRYLLGWKAYVGYAGVRSSFKEWDSWMQRRLRCYRWRPWGRRGYKELRKRGVSRDLAWNTAKSADGPWRLSRSPALAMVLPGSHFDGLGVPRLYIKGSAQPNRRGT